MAGALSSTQSRFSKQPIFGVKRKLWRMDDEHAQTADDEFKKVREEILIKANFTCHFCDFRAINFQEVHHLDNNHQNNDPSNLICTCTLCHLVHHIGMLAMKNGGFIAPIPELTQTEINHLCRAHFVLELMTPASQGGSELVDARKMLAGMYSIFQDRADQLKSIHPEASSLYNFAETLAVMDEQQYDKRAQIFDGLRIIPTPTAFHPNQLEFYAKPTFRFFNAEKWKGLANQILDNADQKVTT